MSLKQVLLISLCMVIVPVLTYAQPDCGNCPMATKQVCAATMDSAKKDEPVYNKLPGYDKKVPMGEYYFTYRFVKRPQIGTIILRVQVFNKAGKQVKPFEVTGEYGMPSMKGAHDSGVQPFKTNVKRDYLLPISLVMRGEWEVKLVFSGEDNKPVYRGFFKFSV
ncbi:MAG: hypothetical protein QME74_07140 [Candidatus Edwardsbacteria bacterium]|nr:hypothetical protein [Candidatus Edwardsbacteria bacterium]